MYCLEIHCVSRMLEWNNWLLFLTRRRIVMPTSKPRGFMMQIDGTIRPSTCLWVRARMNGCSLLSLSFELWIFSCRDTFWKCVNLCCCRSLMKNPGAPAGKIDISIRVFFYTGFVWKDEETYQVPVCRLTHFWRQINNFWCIRCFKDKYVLFTSLAFIRKSIVWVFSTSHRPIICTNWRT